MITARGSGQHCQHGGDLAVIQSVEELFVDGHGTVFAGGGCGGPVDDRDLALKMTAGRVTDRGRRDMHRAAIGGSQPITCLGGWSGVDDTDRSHCLGTHRIDDLGDRGRVRTSDVGGDLFEQLRLGPLHPGANV